MIFKIGILSVIFFVFVVMAISIYLLDDEDLDNPYMKIMRDSKDDRLD